MPVILETISQILKYVNVGVDELNVRYGMRFVYSAVEEQLYNTANDPKMRQLVFFYYFSKDCPVYQISIDCSASLLLNSSFFRF